MSGWVDSSRVEGTQRDLHHRSIDRQTRNTACLAKSEATTTLRRYKRGEKKKERGERLPSLSNPSFRFFTVRLLLFLLFSGSYSDALFLLEAFFVCACSTAFCHFRVDLFQVVVVVVRRERWDEIEGREFCTFAAYVVYSYMNTWCVHGWLVAWQQQH
jgi:hypothetical protein